VAKIRIATRQGQTFDAEWPNDQFNFDVFTANVRALQAVTLPGIFIPYAELQYLIFISHWIWTSSQQSVNVRHIY
jgi:hypothetical protein